jgi:hypothetical protein
VVEISHSEFVTRIRRHKRILIVLSLLHRCVTRNNARMGSPGRKSTRLFFQSLEIQVEVRRNRIAARIAVVAVVGVVVVVVRIHHQHDIEFLAVIVETGHSERLVKARQIVLTLNNIRRINSCRRFTALIQALVRDCVHIVRSRCRIGSALVEIP